MQCSDFDLYVCSQGMLLKTMRLTEFMSSEFMTKEVTLINRKLFFWFCLLVQRLVDQRETLRDLGECHTRARSDPEVFPLTGVHVQVYH